MISEPVVAQEAVKESFNLVAFFDTYINVITGGATIIGLIVAILKRNWLVDKAKKHFGNVERSQDG